MAKYKSVHKKLALPNRATPTFAPPSIMPALSAKEHDPHVNAYFQHLIDNSKLALCAVMRKLLHAIHGILKYNQPFDNSRFYAIPVSENS